MAKYRILVIDDTRVIRLSLKSLFERIGAEVLELGNAEDLFQSSWRYHNLNLIFLDVDLPGMNGMTALIKIKEEPKWTNVPVIMLTSNADPVLVKRAIQNGIVDYVRKPFTSEALLRRVKILLNIEDEATSEAAPPAQGENTPASAQETSAPEAIAPPSPTAYTVLVEIDSAGKVPASFTTLLKPPASSNLQMNGVTTLSIPFQFTGNIESATSAILQLLKQNQIPTEKCKVLAAE